MIPIKCILPIFLAAVCCNCQSEDNLPVSSSWAKLKISPETFSSMKYGNFRIEIYEHANNQKATTTAGQKIYFYSPIALLDHTSAVGTYNRFTKQPEMRFRVEMWNDEVENEVVKHLNKIVDQEIQFDKVMVFPIEKIILTSNTPTEDYSLSPKWTNYHSKSKSVWFSLTCYDRKVCDELADETRSLPRHLDHLKLLYSLSSQTLQTKQTTISFDSVTSGQMVAKFLQNFGDKKEIFLTASDEKKMLAEIATNIRMDTFDDFEVGSPDTDIKIYNILKDLMITSRTTIKDQNDKMWDSVFWNDDNYRPDRTTKILNEIIERLDMNTQKKLIDLFQKAEKSGKTKYIYDSNSWADVDIISSAISEKIATHSDNSSRIEILKEDVEKILQESRNHVQWDGRKFVSKPMPVSKINLDKFRDPQSFQDRNVRVRYTTAELSAPIKFMENVELTVTDEWNNLKDELKATVELLNTTLMGLVETNTVLSNVKSDLTNAKIDLTNESEGTKKELEKTRANVNDLSMKLNATEKEMAEMKIRAGNLSTELKTNSHRLGHEIKVAEENMKKELRAISNNLEITSFASTRSELSSIKSAVADLTTKLNNRTSEIVDIGKMPTSCADLQRMGHKLSGFFSVKGSKKMEMVYCDFHPNQNEKQKWIGNTDIKSSPVHFHVQRNSSFTTTDEPIPFDLARVNEGNAMNLTSGKFTAPRTGIYFFSFTGLARFPSSSSNLSLGIRFYLNGVSVLKDEVDEGNSVSDQDSPVTLQSTLSLKSGDQVWVLMCHLSSGAKLYDDSDHFTQFTGFVLEEEIVASL